MKYFLFLDECGDQNLANFDTSFPIFTLCGILISEKNYDTMEKQIVNMKRKYWDDKKIILHSRDIRKCEKGFEILFDINIKKSFYDDINLIMTDNVYTIITCSILKENYIKKYGRLGDVYGLSLSYIIEQTVFALEEENAKTVELNVFAEKRGKREDSTLLNYYNEVLDRGSYFVESQRIKKYFKSFDFKSKKENIIGLQIADIVAYPVTKYILDRDFVNFAFDIIKPKIYVNKDGKISGIKVFP